jgi:hypothetical protein
MASHYSFRSKLLVVLGASATLLADVSYEQTSRVTGGSLANMPIVGGKLKEPQTTLHLVKGNRMAMAARDSVTVYDLDKETITTVNNERKEFSVMTFAEMREAMDKAMQKMQQATSQQKGEMTWTVKVSDTGETKNINGFDAKKFIVSLDGVTKDEKSGKTIGTRMIMDSWMSKDVPGMAEVNSFNKRMAEKLGAGRAAGISPMVQAQMGKGWYEAAKEFAKMDGFNVMTVTRVQTTVDGEVMMVPESQQQAGVAPQVNAGDVAKDAATSTALGRMGRAGAIGGALGGLRRKKPAADEQTKSQQPAASGNMVPATTMEMTMEVTSASRGAVDASKFDVPAGYKQVESEMKKLAK